MSDHVAYQKCLWPADARRRSPMIDITWSQISGGLVGGLVGGFSGFVANIFQEHKQFRRVRRNVACALVGEIDALRQHIEDNYLAKLRAEVQSVAPNNRSYPYYA